MEKNFDFDRIGKRMPYRTPEGFFEEMEANVLKEVKRETAVPCRRKPVWLQIFAGAVAVAACVTLILVLHPFSPGGQANGLSEVEQAFAELSSEDQAYMLAVFQDDIFMLNE